MLEFCALSFKDREWIIQRMAEDDRQACEYTFANNFLWSDIYGVTMAKCHGCLILRFQNGGRCMYTIPIGNGQKKEALDSLLEMERSRGGQLILSSLVKSDLEWLEQNYAGQFTVVTNRDDYD